MSSDPPRAAQSAETYGSLLVLALLSGVLVGAAAPQLRTTLSAHGAGDGVRPRPRFRLNALSGFFSTHRR